MKSLVLTTALLIGISGAAFGGSSTTSSTSEAQGPVTATPAQREAIQKGINDAVAVKPSLAPLVHNLETGTPSANNIPGGMNPDGTPAANNAATVGQSIPTATGNAPYKGLPGINADGTPAPVQNTESKARQ